MNIDIAIMGHISRSAYVDDLLFDLNTKKASVDDGTLGVWGNARKTWAMIDKNSDYGIVIQDDAILCDKFRDKATSFLAEHNGNIVSFYFGDSRKSFKYLRPIWFDAPLYHAVALAIPTRYIDEMIQYCDNRTEVQGDDMKIRRWLISKNMTCRYSNPSLVQHHDIISIVDPEKSIRQSAIFQK